MSTRGGYGRARRYGPLILWLVLTGALSAHTTLSVPVCAAIVLVLLLVIAGAKPGRGSRALRRGRRGPRRGLPGRHQAQTTWVYIYWNRRGYRKPGGGRYPASRPGYVGITNSLWHRHAQHLRDPIRPHARDATHKTVEKFATRELAEARERELCACTGCGGLDPIYNVALTCRTEGHRRSAVERLVR